MYLTYIGAAERPHRDVRAGVYWSRCRDAREGVPAVLGAVMEASMHSAPPSVAGRSPGRR
jgi:hypothetical protein